MLDGSSSCGNPDRPGSAEESSRLQRCTGEVPLECLGSHSSEAGTGSSMHGISMLALLAHHERAWCPECQLATDSLLPYAGLWDRQVLSKDQACCEVGMTGGLLQVLHLFMADQAPSAHRWLFKSDVAASKASQALLGKAFRLPDRLIGAKTSACFRVLSSLRLLLTLWCAAAGHFYQGKPAAQKLAATGQQPAVPSFASSALWRAHSRFATQKEAFRLRQEAACQTMLRHGRSAKEAASMHARRLEASLKLMPAFRLQRVLLPPVIV